MHRRVVSVVRRPKIDDRFKAADALALMSAPAQPANEAPRLAALGQCDHLDRLPDRALDELAALAAHICDAPISLISLVGENRQWLNSKSGALTGDAPRESSFSARANDGSQLFVVPDARLDERFADSPLVTGEENVRFYAGVPLLAPDGDALGTLSVFDHVPRELTSVQADALQVLSRQVVAQLELRRQSRELVQNDTCLMDVFRSCPVGIAIHRWSDRTFVDVNAAFTSLFGWQIDDLLGRTTQEMGIADSRETVPLRSRLLSHQPIRNTELEVKTRAGETRYVLLGSVLTDFHDEPHTITTFVDITERKQAELAAGRCAAIIESSLDAIIGKDLDGVITSWNGGATKIFGYTAAEMIGTNVMQLIPDDRTDEEVHILRKIRAGEAVEAFETLRRRKDGCLIDVLVTASPIKDPHGTVIGAAKRMLDISDRKRAEGVLREREEQLRLYAEHSPAAIAMLDRDLKYLVVSRRWKEAFRLGEGSLVGRSHYDVFPEIPRKWREANQRSLDGAVQAREMEIFPRADGTVDWLRWETRPWHTADGSIGGIIVFAENITERIVAGAALQASEERMRFALENAEIGIWDMDYRANTVRWSNTLEAQYGLEPGTFPGTTDAVLALVHPDDRETFRESTRQAIKFGGDFSVLSRTIWPNGEVRWLNGAGRIQLDDRGLPVRGVGISMDVTERHRLEEQYQQAQRMEAIGRLAGGVAHDFNNLLTVILGYCELLMRDFEEVDERRADVAEIQSAGRRASSLTRQLLAFSRKQMIAPRLIDINAVATDLDALLRRLIGEDIQIALDLAPDLALVMADRGQIEQIVMNLAVNARDAMPKGGVLSIKTANAPRDEHQPQPHPSAESGDCVMLIVSDTGSGMTPDVRARVFEPFFTTKDVGKGTGLGLSTVYGIVAQNGGSIDIDTELGKGTSFRICFPQATESEGVAEAVVMPARPLAAMKTVLLVEDENGVRELARKLLERLGYVVLVASNAEEAMLVVEKNDSIDVVLTDVVMPGASGTELTTRIEQLRSGIKFVYMSGYTEEAIVPHGVLRPGILFLNKPFSSETLGEKIRQALEQ
jgi:two-component system cell cycle sensor histidine kinase/response regulator CckA